MYKYFYIINQEKHIQLSLIKFFITIFQFSKSFLLNLKFYIELNSVSEIEIENIKKEDTIGSFRL